MDEETGTVCQELRDHHALVLDETLRELISSGEYAQLQAVDTVLYQCIRAVDRTRVQNIVDYIAP